MSDRFVGVARGQALRGSRAIAEYLLGDPQASESAQLLNRYRAAQDISRIATTMCGPTEIKVAS
jgi:hypothetical protein